MCENPSSLEECCLDVICENILTYIEPQIQTKDGWTSTIEGSDCYDDERSDKRYKFRDPDIYLINKVSERLMNRMMEKRILCDATLNIFSERNTKLRSVKIKNCKVTKCGLQMLKQHKITDLEVVNLKNVSIGDILDCLNEWTVQNLMNANFSKCTFIDICRYSFMVRISNLKALKSLNLSYTEFNQAMYKIICEDLKNLEKLDISGTLIKDLRPLALLADKLTSLSICDLNAASESMIPTLQLLRNLKYLDISLFNDKVDSHHLPHTYVVAELLETEHIFPHLVSLDVSGWKDVVARDPLLRFINTHPRLEFLGIVFDAVTFDPVFCDIKSRDNFQNLRIAGLGTEQQIKVTLQCYKERSNYVQKALYHLFQLTTSFSEARPDIFNLVLPVMEAHSSRFGVQMAATACLYNLTRGELSKNIHPKALSRGVDLTLIAMETFPDEFQLQKNSLLTLCSDRILQEVNFDRFRCARLVLDALCGFEDVNMNRMAVAICSILASKVSTEETSELGARPVYMRKLLAMVQSRVESRLSDITLKFTLSALWNLTDESAATCNVFLEQGGAVLFLNVLRTFRDNSAIETKILGLLNNIAEVAKLRQNLITDALVNELFVLLKSENIDVSYFAAGIVAHLTSDGDEHWKVTTHTRNEMLTELEQSVSQWRVPDGEMVAYRSFKPFFPLLRVDMNYQVQLWAVWAIHHVCTKNPKRYCPMLQEERGHSLLTDLMNYAGSHWEIKRISCQILDTLTKNGVQV
ncbi:protein zyg-11 homolog B-like [Cylas formicarius]|uniref:protein zyg-11 homolog B-like n=1 Tax=Cylas formicarius TaxID=197179 RepID=UPI00295846B7|nr:protein zyg-11 homolog B-like [Cylas formicarius]XP_060534394.1 protein zyg-11 homolog B-like [Cylas formicarius]